MILGTETLEPGPVSAAAEAAEAAREFAHQMRTRIIELAYRSKSGHVGSALSCTDILSVLYSSVLRLDPWESRDIFILSKAHASMSLYSALTVRGIISDKILFGYYQNEGTLPAHLDRFSVEGVEVSAGSLGHGFNVGLGMAHGFKKSGENRRVFAVIGDGESQEGSIWEGALFAPKLGLDNFVGIADCNNLQGYGRPSSICSFEPVKDKWAAFGWEVAEIDGHDHAALYEVLSSPGRGKPRMVIARTTKGKGVSFMEDELVWHYYIVTEEIRARALALVEAARGDATGVAVQ